MVKFRYLFHGTSSVHRESILQTGLTPRETALYLTTHPMVALIEAGRTVDGEGNLREGYKTGIGGTPLIVLVERKAATHLKLDNPGYYERHEGIGYRPSEVRFAFTTTKAVPPASISLIEGDLHSKCIKLLDDIESMNSQPVFGFAIKVDFGKKRVYRC